MRTGVPLHEADTNASRHCHCYAELVTAIAEQLNTGGIRIAPQIRAITNF